MSDPTDHPYTEGSSEVAIPDEVIDPRHRGRYRAPLWLTLALATVAVAALGVALASFRETRILQDNLTAFQTEIFASGERAVGTLNATSSGLSVLVDQPLIFTARVDQEVPFSASVPFIRRLDVPIQTSIQINEVIETTIVVAGPFGWDVPVDVTVPIDLVIPVDITVPIEINEVIEVDTTTRLKLDVPVELDLEESGLAALVRQMSSNLTRLADSIPTPGPTPG